MRLSSQFSTSPRPHLYYRGWLREIVEAILLIVTLYTLINLTSARYMVQGQSMYPSFDDYQVLYISRLNYIVGDPERTDIVVFHYPRNPDEDYIKRVIGLPGDIVEIRNTQVYVNGEPLNEPYINEACNPGDCPENRWNLGPDEFFVMGDNRNHSSDSRAFGPIRRELIVGKVLVRYWPPQDWGLVGQIGAE